MWTLLTVVNLLQSYLSIVWQGLLSLRAQHERLWFLRCHGRMLGIHHEHLPLRGCGRLEGCLSVGTSRSGPIKSRMRINGPDQTSRRGMGLRMSVEIGREYNPVGATVDERNNKRCLKQLEVKTKTGGGNRKDRRSDRQVSVCARGGCVALQLLVKGGRVWRHCPLGVSRSG